MALRRWRWVFLAALIVGLGLVPVVVAGLDAGEGEAGGASRASGVGMSHRLIVELAAPSLAEWVVTTQGALPAGGERFDLASPAARAHLDWLLADQQRFLAALHSAVPGADVATYLDERGQPQPATYALLFNGLAVDGGKEADPEMLAEKIRDLPGVRTVSPDRAYAPALYASVPLIGAPRLWQSPRIGGQGEAGRGIRFASIDGGIHKDAPMFSGVGYHYPPGYPKGDTRNTNGKIIVSRAYFRPYDPPAPGDENSWPGVRGTPHGVHTASIAAGRPVVAPYYGITETISGVAPHAYVMSYRVFYPSVSGDGSFYTAEGLRAIEDMVRDGADVVNNSWDGLPLTSGGEFDPLDAALARAVSLGVVTVLSEGNSGPGLGTGGFPSDDYINVGMSTSGATFDIRGRLNVVAPEPVSPTIQAIVYRRAGFGDPMRPGARFGPFPLITARSLGSDQGCGHPETANPFPTGSLTGRAVLIRGGNCAYDEKVLNAARAGAVLAIVFNPQGDGLVTMPLGSWGSQIGIPAIFIGQTAGERLAGWYDLHPTTTQVSVDVVARQAGNRPDMVAANSSRGPGAGGTLKPDLVAPGVDILAQGFAPRTTGEARHLGFGEATGTSMAAPHVSGAAILLRQIHPTWSPAWIKSALMSTAKFMDITTHDGRAAQPLDMGAGRLDLTHAADPGVILDPPSLSFGFVVSRTAPVSLTVRVTSVATATESYTLTTLYTGAGFTATTPIAGMTISPTRLTLAPGETGRFTVVWAPPASRGYGDNQGFVLLAGEHHAAHLPAWVRLIHAPSVDVLVIDNDGSANRALPDYTGVYTRTLTALGYSYEVWDADRRAATGVLTTFPDATALTRYRALLYQTGDNATRSSGAPPTAQDLDRLIEYVNGGGHLLAFGQNLAAVTGAANNVTLFFNGILGTSWVQESVSGGAVVTMTAAPVVGLPATPFRHLTVDLSARGDGAGNQRSVDEIALLRRSRGCDDTVNPALCDASFVPLLKYVRGQHLRADGIVGAAHREPLTLERPGTTFAGSTLLFTFGLEGVNNTTGYDSREALLGTALGWSLDAPTVSITATVRPAGELTRFRAALATPHLDGATYRWDFGDGSSPTEATESVEAGHRYAHPGRYTVRVEAANGQGTRVLATQIVEIPPANGGAPTIYLPLLFQAAFPPPQRSADGMAGRAGAELLVPAISTVR